MRRNAWMLAVVVALGGCGGPGDETEPADTEFLEATPDPLGFEAEVTGDAAAEGLGSSSQALTSGDGVGSSTQHLDSAAPEYLQNARQAVRGLNGIVRAAMAPIVALIQNNPDLKTGDTHVWGPQDRGNATY
ncbi:MAG: hypothetical protein ACK4N5_03095, partial [Myxococcales bacterium]